MHRPLRCRSFYFSVLYFSSFLVFVVSSVSVSVSLQCTSRFPLLAMKEKIRSSKVCLYQGLPILQCREPFENQGVSCTREDSRDESLPWVPSNVRVNSKDVLSLKYSLKNEREVTSSKRWRTTVTVCNEGVFFKLHLHKKRGIKGSL